MRISQPGLLRELAPGLPAWQRWRKHRFSLVAKCLKGKKRCFSKRWWHRQFRNFIRSYFSFFSAFPACASHQRGEAQASCAWGRRPGRGILPQALNSPHSNMRIPNFLGHQVSKVWTRKLTQDDTQQQALLNQRERQVSAQDLKILKKKIIMQTDPPGKSYPICHCLLIRFSGGLIPLWLHLEREQVCYIIPPGRRAVLLASTQLAVVTRPFTPCVS